MTGVGDGALDKIVRQQGEILHLVKGGLLDPSRVIRALQNVIDRKPTSIVTWSQPYWWRNEDQQLELASQLWPGVNLPDPPCDFVPKTRSEVLLLHVPDEYRSLWDKISPSGVSKKKIAAGLELSERCFKLTQGRVDYKQPVWLAFDPDHAKGEAPSKLRMRSDVAASEVFSALVQFPEWPLAWCDGSFTRPQLSGFELCLGDVSGRVPYLTCRDDQLILTDSYSSIACRNWASPSVREC